MALSVWGLARLTQELGGVYMEHDAAGTLSMSFSVDTNSRLPELPELQGEHHCCH